MIKIFTIRSDIANQIERVVFSHKIRWQFKPGTVNKQEILENNWPTKVTNFNILEKFFFHKVIFPNNNSRTDRTLHQEIKPLEDIIANKIINVPVSLQRIYYNMQLYSSSNAITQPHFDNSDDSFISCVYYVNNSSGDTFIFDRNGKIVKNISPNKGTGVVFKSNYIHAGSYPNDENNPRAVINFVFKILPSVNN